MYYLLPLITVAILLGLWLVGLILRMWITHRHNLEDLRMRQALRDFEAEKAKAIAVALVQRASLKVTPDRSLEITQHWHTVRVPETLASSHQEQATPDRPPIKQPSMHYIISEIEEGSLSVSPGVRADTGELVVLSIEDAVHFKLIGSSGFGKSCLAAALLEQAIKLNPPELLQIALLDLEHKTSRLFEDAPNVADLRVGRKLVPMVATNADEVATYLGYLKSELDRRARLSESDLQREPILLMYVEEMLSLQYEVDEKLQQRMLADLSVLAIRARKYRMFLLACAQTDYSTPELKTAQKQFRTRIAYAIDTTAARAAGFMSADLIKKNFTTSQKGDGQFVLESPGIASLMLAPVYDVRQKLLVRERSTGVQQPFTRPEMPELKSGRTAAERDANDERTIDECTPEAHSAEVAELRALGWSKQAIIEKVWECKKGSSIPSTDEQVSGPTPGFPKRAELDTRIGCVRISRNWSVRGRGTWRASGSHRRDCCRVSFLGGRGVRVY